MERARESGSQGGIGREERRGMETGEQGENAGAIEGSDRQALSAAQDWGWWT